LGWGATTQRFSTYAPGHLLQHTRLILWAQPVLLRMGHGRVISRPSLLAVTLPQPLVPYAQFCSTYTQGIIHARTTYAFTSTTYTSAAAFFSQLHGVCGAAALLTSSRAKHKRRADLLTPHLPLAPETLALLAYRYLPPSTASSWFLYIRDRFCTDSAVNALSSHLTLPS